MKKRDYSPSSTIVHSGFLAQDIEKTCLELGYNFDGLHIPNDHNKTDHYSVAYSQFIMPLVKAVQELDEKNKELDAKNTALQNEITQLEKANKNLGMEVIRVNDLEDQNKTMKADIAEVKTLLQQFSKNAIDAK